MFESEKPKFFTALGYMFSLYPNLTVGEAAQSAYWEHVKHLPLELLRQTIHRVVAENPKFPPTGQQLKEGAEVEQRAAAARANDPRTMRALPRASWEHVPRTPQGQAAYIGEGHGGFERLARLYECEAVRRGLRPDQPPPRELGEAWWKQFNAMSAKEGLFDK